MKNGKITIITFIFISIILSINTSCAQEKHIGSQHLGWVSSGIGASSNGFLYGFNFNYQYNRSIFSVQIDAEIKDPRKEFPETTSDVSFLYGISSNTNSVIVARLLAGVGGVSRTYFENVVTASLFGEELEQVEIIKNTVGFPIRAELMLNGKFIAVGLTGLANINSLNTYTGLMFTVQIGLMR